MSERPYIRKIRQLLEETRDMEKAQAGKAPLKAANPVAPDEQDADLALLDELEAGLEEGSEEGLEGSGDLPGAGNGAAASTGGAGAAGEAGRGAEPQVEVLRRGRASGTNGKPKEKGGLARLLQRLGDLQERRKETMARGRRPARMLSPNVMREAAGQEVDKNDPVAQRRRKQIQEFRAAWIESLNQRKKGGQAALSPIATTATVAAEPAPATAQPAAAAPTPEGGTAGGDKGGEPRS